MLQQLIAQKKYSSEPLGQAIPHGPWATFLATGHADYVPSTQTCFMGTIYPEPNISDRLVGSIVHSPFRSSRVNCTAGPVTEVYPQYCWENPCNTVIPRCNKKFYLYR
jgi:hypothetical protein